jgi:hypothetical protein
MGLFHMIETDAFGKNYRQVLSYTGVMFLKNIVQIKIVQIEYKILF